MTTHQPAHGHDFSESSVPVIEEENTVQQSAAVADNSNATNIEPSTSMLLSAENQDGLSLLRYKWTVETESKDQELFGSLSRFGINIRELRKAAYRERNGLSKEKHPINPDLCVYCRVFFDTWTTAIDSFTFPFHHTLEEIQISASQGCQLCAQFRSSFHIQQWETELLGEPDFKFPVHISDLQVSPVTGHSKHRFIRLGTSDGYYFPRRLCIGPEIAQGQSLKVEHSLPHCYPQNSGQVKYDYSGSSLTLVREWLNDCRLNHGICSLNNYTIAPTRLIKIEEGDLRLCLSSGLEGCSKYATLSHCWGSIKILKLLSSNISLFLQEIPYDRLSKTFQDAIDIARDLGFSWLWIDSLCIIQDDLEDWKREATCMATVYGMSSLNIVASAAPDGNTGCLFERDPIHIGGTRVVVHTNDKKEEIGIAGEDLLIDNVYNTPLSRRAWALQEQVLAPRNLYFGISQVVWECTTAFSYEEFPNGLPKIYTESSIFSVSKRNLWQSWHTIVLHYSGAKLTYEKDKSVAIAGIARRIWYETRYEYIAGLWRQNLEGQLCWKVDHHLDLQQQGLRPMKMPSWSWMAVDGRVSMLDSMILSSKSYIKLISVVVTFDNTPVSDPFGSFNGGVLTIFSKYILNCTVVERTGYFQKRVNFAHTAIDAYVNWDYEACQKPCILLPVGNFDRDNGDVDEYSILLRPTENENGQYKRIGLLQNSYDSYPWLRPPKKLGTLLDDLFKTPDHMNCSECALTLQDYQSVKVEDGATWYTITII